MSSPGAHKRYQMERERLEREEHELSGRTRLKRAAARHTMAFWNVALAAGWRTILLSERRHGGARNCAGGVVVLCQKANGRRIALKS